MQGAVLTAPTGSAGGDRTVGAWLEEAAPGLLANRTIRGFLEQYPQRAWPEVLRLALIHGVASLNTAYPGLTLTAAQLRAAVERGAIAAAVERKLPTLQRELLDLQYRLDGVYDDISGGGARPQLAGAATVRGASGRGSNLARSRSRLPMYCRPTPCLRTHSAPLFPSQVQQKQAAFTAAALPDAAHRPGTDQLTRGALLPSRPANLLLMSQAGRNAAAASKTADLLCAAAPRGTAIGPRVDSGRTRRRRSAVLAPKPSAQWREGEATGFPSPRRRAVVSPRRRSMGERGCRGESSVTFSLLT
jgi:hypothetical protein